MAVKRCLLWALAAAALAQPAGRGTVSGVVIDAVSGDPIRKAVVTITWQGTPRSWARSRTDSSGHFEFSGLPVGKYDLHATKAGIGTAINGANSVRELGELITLGDGETVANVKLRFLHSGTITGRVFDPDGDPVPGAQVALLRPSRSVGVRMLTNYKVVSTNDRGEYSLTGIDPGEYFAKSMPGRFGAPVGPRRNGATDPPQDVTVAAFYGGARTSKDAAPLNIRGGETLAGVDFHLAAGQIATLHGHISGLPAPADARRTAVNPQGMRMFKEGEFVQITLHSLDDEQSRLNFGSAVRGDEWTVDQQALVAGRYMIHATASVASKQFGVTQIVDLHAGMNEIDLALAPPIEIKGQVRYEGQKTGQAAPPAAVFTQRGIGGDAVQVQIEKDGHFSTNLFAGEWEIDVNPRRGSFLKSVKLGDKDILFTRFEVASADQPVNVLISSNTATIEGDVEGGARAGIMLAPVGRLHDFLRFYYGSPADAEGKFKLTGLAPGKYRIFAFEKMAAAPFRNPEAADKLQELGEEVELEEGKTLEVHPKLIPQDRAREALP